MTSFLFSLLFMFAISQTTWAQTAPKTEADTLPAAVAPVAEDTMITHERRGEFYLGFGTSKDVGSLFADGTVNHYLSLGARFWAPAFSPQRKYRGFFEVDYTSINSDEVTENKFPFATGVGATVKQFAFVPNITLYSSAHWNWFLGVGPALLLIDSSDHNNQQTYGTFLWQGGVIYEFNQNWNFGVRTQWMKISEKVSGQKYFQEFWNTNWFFSYAPDWLNGRNE